jgi:hypothetical protein
MPSPLAQGPELQDIMEEIPPSPQGKGHLLLLLKTKRPRTPRGKGHHLLLLQSNQSFYPTLIERLLSHFLPHSS